jgi:CCR4-NOT transcription complex subunit 4
VFISVLSVKRQTQQKKCKEHERKERERKELDALGWKQFTNVHVVQHNVVYVVGLGSRLAKEEVLHITSTASVAHDICSSSQLSDRTSILGNTARSPRSSLSSATSLGQSLRSLVSITYHRREDAVRAIHAVDGSPSSSGGGDVMRASHGTTKYCMSFLRGQNCSNNGCLDLHEWGDGNVRFTKEDLTRF